MFLTFGDDRLDFVEVCLKRKIVELLEAQRISCEITISDTEECNACGNNNGKFEISRKFYVSINTNV